ncbi:MAG: LysM peptidoglycan-binding domain-containing protein [Bdellovibrio sp.]|nr:LysM peptidoglycan-binding domain-containing protein [Bdellovibrio sp.]
MKSKFIFLFLVYLNAGLISQSHAQAPATPDAAAAHSSGTNGSSTPTLTTTPPGVRPQNGEKDPQKESSSFMGDPSNLDPMKPKKENLKEDEEPVLEDIRQVLDEPEKKPEKKIEKKSEAPAKAAEKLPTPPPDTKGLPPEFNPQNTVTPSATPKKAKTLPAKKNKKQKVVKPHVAPVHHEALHNLQSDDPDYRLEKKFNTTYKAYNAQPTSVEAWGAVLNNRPSQVYVVQKGDTLWSISKTLFGDPLFWPKIWALNRMGIVNPHFITPGLQVMFYAGGEDTVPSLALGAKSDKSSETSKVESSESADEQSSLTSLDGGIRAGVIPDSLPLSRNDNYFLPPKSMQVDLQNDVEVNDAIGNDILLTNEPIKSEIDVPIQEIVRGHCGGNHILKSKIAMAPNSDFKIYELLEGLKMDVGSVQAYRYVGEAHSLVDSKLKVNSCSTVMSDYLVFVSPQSVAGLRANKMSAIKEPEILGGPNLGTQSMFSGQQLIYINLGLKEANVGQSAYIISQITEQRSGEVKILDKFGSIAIGILTEVNDLVEKGDTISLER